MVFFIGDKWAIFYFFLIHRYSTLFIILHVVFVWIVIDVIFSKTSFIGFSLSHSKQNKQKCTADYIIFSCLIVYLKKYFGVFEDTFSCLWDSLSLNWVEQIVMKEMFYNIAPQHWKHMRSVQIASEAAGESGFMYITDVCVILDTCKHVNLSVLYTGQCVFSAL